MHVSMFFLVGAVGGYLADRIRLKGRELESAESRAGAAQIDTDYILNNMSSGVLVVDTDGTRRHDESGGRGDPRDWRRTRS